MKAIKHVTSSASKSVVTIKIECRSPIVARKLFADIAAAERFDHSPLETMTQAIDELTDRQIANLLHGRDKDDNGEFTASSMGAAQDAAHEAAHDVATIVGVATPEVA
ncbi:MAG: hypothetical protein GC182_03005 [Rhodopseudomonas sp.]|nr:hypothetical protein [Rhodopseudomonas sp.]